MHFKKVYGQSQTNECLFCGKIATTKNKQKVPVCNKHINSILNDFKCICGEYLDIRESKYGIFFTCMNCGTVSLSKALEINTISDENNIISVYDL